MDSTPNDRLEAILLGEDITPANRIEELLIANVKASPKWVKISKTYEDFITVGLYNDINLISLPPRTRRHNAFVRVTENFETTEGQLNSVSFRIGDNLDTANIMSLIETNGALGEFASSGGLGDVTIDEDGGEPVMITGGITIEPLVEESLNDLTAGKVDFYLLISALY